MSAEFGVECYAAFWSTVASLVSGPQTTLVLVLPGKTFSTWLSTHALSAERKNVCTDRHEDAEATIENFMGTANRGLAAGEAEWVWERDGPLSPAEVHQSPIFIMRCHRKELPAKRGAV